MLVITNKKISKIFQKIQYTILNYYVLASSPVHNEILV